MREDENKRYETNFGRVTEEDYKNTSRRDYSFRSLNPRQTQEKQESKKTEPEATKSSQSANITQKKKAASVKRTTSKTQKTKLYRAPKKKISADDVKETILAFILPDGLLGEKSLSTYGLDYYEKTKLGNPTIFICVVLLSAFGLLMVASSSSYYAFYTSGNAYFYLNKQLFFLIGGLALCVGFSYLPLKWVQKLTFFAYVVALGLNIYVLFFGEEVNGSTRWIDVFGLFSFQPSEAAKVALVLYLSALMERFHEKIKTWGVFIGLLLVILIMIAPIALENLSTACIIAVIALAVLMAGGVGGGKIIILIGIAVLVFCFYLIQPALEENVNLLEFKFEDWGYRVQRIRMLGHPEDAAYAEGYQILQGLYSLGSGGLFGRGLGESLQKLGFIPEAYNDIIFAVICEETGVIGSGFIVLLYGILGICGYRKVLQNQNIFGSLVTMGITTQIIVQAIINMGVNLAILPTTGASLPFISYGGSSLLFLFTGVGLMLNATRYAGFGRKQIG